MGGFAPSSMKNATTFWGPADVFFSGNLIDLPKQGCCVTVGPGADFERLNDAIEALLAKDIGDICICLTAGDHALSKPISLAGGARVNVSIHGCGPATRLDFGGHLIDAMRIGAFELADLQFKAGNAVLRAKEVASVTLRRLTGRTGGYVLDARQCAVVTVEDSDLEAFDPNIPPPPPPPPPPPAPAAPAGGGRAARTRGGGALDTVLAALDVILDTSLITPIGVLTAIAMARDLILLDGYDGQVRIVRNRLNGAINIGGQQPGSIGHRDYLYAWQGKEITTVLHVGGTLTIADNMMYDLRVTGLPARLLGVDQENPTSMGTIKVPRLARLERNEILAPKSVLAAHYAIVDGNRFVLGGAETEQLLVIVPRSDDDDDPTAKIIGNSGPKYSLIVSTGYPDETANRPLQVMY